MFNGIYVEIRVSSHEALDLCRGMAVAVPRAALAQVVELANGAASEAAPEGLRFAAGHPWNAAGFLSRRHTFVYGTDHAGASFGTTDRRAWPTSIAVATKPAMNLFFRVLYYR
jgi:hypothetical protein